MDSGGIHRQADLHLLAGLDNAAADWRIQDDAVAGRERLQNRLGFACDILDCECGVTLLTRIDIAQHKSLSLVAELEGGLMVRIIPVRV